jgi:hypothetical protein
MSYRKTITTMENDKGKKERYERFFYQAERGSNGRISDKAIKSFKTLRETARFA